MSALPFHPEVLPASARAVLQAIGRADWSRALYLAGGTACALHLGHRVSDDLDFFSRMEFSPDFYRDRLADLGPAEVHAEGLGTLHMGVSKVKVSVLHFPAPLLDPLGTLDRVAIAGRRDLALMKLSAISQRGTRRDFVDLFALCEAGPMKIRPLFRLFKKKFPRIRYSEAHLLRSLVYFADAEREPELRMLRKIPWNRVRGFFEREVRAALR